MISSKFRLFTSLIYDISNSGGDKGTTYFLNLSFKHNRQHNPFQISSKIVFGFLFVTSICFSKCNNIFLQN